MHLAGATRPHISEEQHDKQGHNAAERTTHALRSKACCAVQVLGQPARTAPCLFQLALRREHGSRQLLPQRRVLLEQSC